MRMHALAVMHRRTLYENVDSAKIKVPFYTTDIDILRVVSMPRSVIHCIDISMNRFTPRFWYGQAHVMDNDHRCISLMAF